MSESAQDRSETSAPSPLYVQVAASVGLLLAATVIYALVPWPRFAPGSTPVVVLVVTFVGGLAGATALVEWQVRAYRQAAASGAPGSR